MSGEFLGCNLKEGETCKAVGAILRLYRQEDFLDKDIILYSAAGFLNFIGRGVEPESSFADKSKFRDAVKAKIDSLSQESSPLTVGPNCGRSMECTYRQKPSYAAR